MKSEYRMVKVRLRRGVAILRMDNPPVNQLSDHFLEELRTAMGEALDDQAVEAVILTGTGRNFMAGADINQFPAVTGRAGFQARIMSLQQWFNALEAGPKPIIAAINGNCLGGGLELALACHYRLAAEGISLGLPEVTLGLLPGGGGTQRLPRLIGLAEALELMITGEIIEADKSLSLGLIDEIAPAEYLMEAALAATGKFKMGKLDHKTLMVSRQTDRLPGPATKQAILEQAKEKTAARSRGYIAPRKIIETAEKGLSGDFQADIALEVSLFMDCLMSDTARNLIRIFLSRRAAGKLPRIEGVQPVFIQKVGLLGGGVMGAGIMHLLLAGGYETILWELDDQALAKAETAIRRTFDWKLKNKKINPIVLEDLLTKKMTKTTHLDELKDVDLVIEAVVEDMAVKQDLWHKLETICWPDVVFGTNTSALPITDMGAELRDPGRLIGLHFFNPAERMDLLEIVCAPQTSDRTLATAVAIARSIKKVPVVVNDGPGFYVSRQLSGLMVGATFLLADGVALETIEEAVTGFGLPMGPATLTDLTGIDIYYHVSRTFERVLGDRYKLHPLIERIYQLGDHGRKTGRGFFDYTGPEPVPNPRVQEVIANYLREQNIRPRQADHHEIKDLIMALCINEATLMIEQGICDRPADMDLAMITGTGFPPYRGGILRYADQWGLENIHQKLLELEENYGPRFKPANLIADMARKGDRFYQG